MGRETLTGGARAVGRCDLLGVAPYSGSANGLGPLVVDPYGNNVYVLGTLSNTLSGFKISPVSGSLMALTPATVATGSGIRSSVTRLLGKRGGRAAVSRTCRK